jgi:HNH endonuclease
MPAPLPITVTAEKLREMLDYSAETGEFRWKISPAPSVRVGDEAGYRTTAGGRAIMIGYKPHACARLAWLYVHGKVPTGMIRHANGDKSDNRISNLSIKADPAKNRDDISLERLRDDLLYDPLTGNFYWKHSRSGQHPVDQAGTVRTDGYVMIGYLAKTYLAHRLAWFYVHGAWPVETVDHINGNPSDNRFVNLRQAKHFENSQNRALKSTNTTGMTGIFKRGRKWFARATVNNYTHTVGSFNTKEEAIVARENLVAAHVGDFARPPEEPH